MRVSTCLVRCEWPPNQGLEPGNERFDRMLESVRREGILEPLTIKLDWTLIDGAHRLAAARFLGLESVPVRVWTGVDFVQLDDREAPLALVVDEIGRLTTKDEVWRLVTSERFRALLSAPEGQTLKSVCQGCGGPHPFDTTVPSVVWNRVIRAAGLTDFLCLTCIVRAFAEAGEGFTAQLWSEEFNGLPVSVSIADKIATSAAEVSDENTRLRAEARDAAEQTAALRAEIQMGNH